MGILPAASVRIFDSSLSMQTTVFPFSARHAPTTSPTYPLPTTAIFMSQQDTDCERVTQGIADRIQEWRSRNCPTRQGLERAPYGTVAACASWSTIVPRYAHGA